MSITYRDLLQQKTYRFLGGVDEMDCPGEVPLVRVEVEAQGYWLPDLPSGRLDR